jgi:hypothetical protein
MASLRVPTLKELGKLSGNDAAEWLYSLERELKSALGEMPGTEPYKVYRKNINARLRRLQARREEWQASKK